MSSNLDNRKLHLQMPHDMNDINKTVPHIHASRYTILRMADLGDNTFHM